MAMRETYDSEHVVRHTHSETTPEDEAGRAGVDERVVRTSPTDDTVILERPVETVSVARPYAADAVHEDIYLDRVVARRAVLDRLTSVVWFAVGVLETLLGLRIAFKLLEANQASGFVRFVNGVTEPFVHPFAGIFSNPTSDGAVLDSGALFAMFIYALIAWAAVRLLWLLLDRTESGVSRSVSRYHRDAL